MPGPFELLILTGVAAAAAIVTVIVWLVSKRRP